MIHPFEPKQIRQIRTTRRLAMSTPSSYRKVLSYGTSSYGYDIRLSPDEFYVFSHIPGEITNPKRFNEDQLIRVPFHSDQDGEFFIIPSNSYALGFALEFLKIPDDVTAICVGKSTYARCGIIANVTPAEAGWQGHLTLEFSNASRADCRIYCNEGVVQLLFLEGDRPLMTYAERDGKYQGQPNKVVVAKV